MSGRGTLKSLLRRGQRQGRRQAKTVRDRIGQLFSRLIGIGTERYDEDIAKRLKIINGVAYLIAISTAIYTIQLTFMDARTYLPVILLNAAIIPVGVIVPWSHRISPVFGVVLMFGIETIALYFFTLFLGVQSGLHLQYFIGAGGPLVMMSLDRKRLAAILTAIMLIAHLTTWFSFRDVAPLVNVPTDLQNSLYIQAALTIFIVIAASVWYAFTLEKRAKAETDALLYNILPRNVAQRLRANPTKEIAEYHESATVLFADVVGFVRLAKSLGPTRAVEILNLLFRKFDALSIAHGVEKIKTIGDAYMAVSGVPKAKTDSASRAIMLGRDMQAFVAQVRKDEDIDLHIRIAIATGPIMAGVLGTQKFSYDVWGDSVNLASRIEARAAANEILICENTHLQLGDKFGFEQRQLDNIKGVGAATAYLLTEQA